MKVYLIDKYRFSYFIANRSFKVLYKNRAMFFWVPFRHLQGLVLNLRSLQTPQNSLWSPKPKIDSIKVLEELADSTKLISSLIVLNGTEEHN